MPEGNEVHRFRDRQAAIFVGRTVRADSPSGQFPDAALLDGRKLRGIVAHGKHLGYDFGRDLILHVHLGRFGDFTEGKMPLVEPKGALRLRIATKSDWLELRGPSDCSVYDQKRWDRLMARLGPDPLEKGSDPKPAFAAIAERKTPIAALLMDQSSNLRHWQYLPRRTAVSGEAQSLSRRKRCRAEDVAGNLEGCDDADGRRNDRPAHCHHASKGPPSSACASRTRRSALCL